MNGKTLVVIDMQRDFVDGSLKNEGAKAIIPNIVRKVNDEDWNAIIFTRDTHDEHYLDTQEGRNLPIPHCIYREEGWQLIEEIERAIVEKGNKGTMLVPPINKPTFGTMEWKDRIRKKECDEIVIVGVCTDICVVSNALIIKTLFPEIKVTVDASCCAGTTTLNHKMALNTMKCCQINVVSE